MLQLMLHLAILYIAVLHSNMVIGKYKKQKISYNVLYALID